LPQRGFDLRGVVRLPEEPSTCRQIAFHYICSPRRDDQFHGRPPVADNTRQTETIHRAGHLNIGKHSPYVIPALKNAYRFVRIRSADRLETRILDDFDRAQANQKFVFVSLAPPGGNGTIIVTGLAG